MSTEQMSRQLLALKERNQFLSDKIKNISFETEAEAQQYIEDNKPFLEELKAVRQQIRDMEWALKTEEEKQNELAQQQALKEKYKDD